MSAYVISPLIQMQTELKQPHFSLWRYNIYILGCKVLSSRGKSRSWLICCVDDSLVLWWGAKPPPAGNYCGWWIGKFNRGLGVGKALTCEVNDAKGSFVNSWGDDASAPARPAYCWSETGSVHTNAFASEDEGGFEKWDRDWIRGNLLLPKWGVVAMVPT